MLHMADGDGNKTGTEEVASEAFSTSPSQRGETSGYEYKAKDFLPVNTFVKISRVDTSNSTHRQYTKAVRSGKTCGSQQQPTFFLSYQLRHFVFCSLKIYITLDAGIEELFCGMKKRSETKVQTLAFRFQDKNSGSADKLMVFSFHWCFQHTLSPNAFMRMVLEKIVA